MEPAQGTSTDRTAASSSALRKWGPVGALAIVAVVVIGIIAFGGGDGNRVAGFVHKLGDSQPHIERTAIFGDGVESNVGFRWCWFNLDLGLSLMACSILIRCR